ncbi:hypothetical protein ABMY47_21680 [Pseudoalteromonas sp. BZP1]|uniref:hypothetical protein n=1 Tax=Pseudoalteromonas sp. BZP1 TaxID=3136671 RepID=UPI0032C453EA
MSKTYKTTSNGLDYDTYTHLTELQSIFKKKYGGVSISKSELIRLLINKEHNIQSKSYKPLQADEWKKLSN